jgi:hypothetical protein
MTPKGPEAGEGLIPLGRSDRVGLAPWLVLPV